MLTYKSLVFTVSWEQRGLQCKRVRNTVFVYNLASKTLNSKSEENLTELLVDIGIFKNLASEVAFQMKEFKKTNIIPTFTLLYSTKTESCDQ
jgi:hypothetical protein